MNTCVYCKYLEDMGQGKVNFICVNQVVNDSTYDNYFRPPVLAFGCNQFEAQT